MARRRKTRSKNEAGDERFALRRFDVVAERADRSLYEASDALGRLGRAQDEVDRRNVLVDVIENLMDASYNLGLAEGHLFHAGRKDPLSVPRFRQLVHTFTQTWSGARAGRIPNLTDRGRAALAAGTTAVTGAVLGGVLLGPAGAVAGSVAGGGVGPYLFLRWMRDPEELGDAVLGGGVGGLFTPLGAAAGAYIAGDELGPKGPRRRANPPARAQNRVTLPRRGEHPLVVVAHGRRLLVEPTPSKREWVLRDGPRTEYVSRKQALDHIEHFQDMGMLPIQRYVANPLRRKNGWIGPTRAVEHYLATVSADRDADGRYLIGGDPPIYGIGGDETVLSDATVYYVDGRPVPLAPALQETSAGVGVRVFNPGRAPNMDPDAAVERLNEAVRQEDWEEADAAWEDLLEWVGKGGFFPETQIQLSDDQAYQWDLDEEDLETILAFNREVTKDRLKARRN